MMTSRWMAIAFIFVAFSALNAQEEAAPKKYKINAIFRDLLPNYNEIAEEVPEQEVKPAVQKPAAAPVVKVATLVAAKATPVKKDNFRDVLQDKPTDNKTPIKAAPQPLNVLSGFSSDQNAQGLMCQMNSENQCKDVRFDMVNLPPQYFNKLPRDRRQQFIQYMTPIAQFMQAKTGFPASVLIAQAILESADGTSYMFNRGNALFGHTCQGRGSRTSLELPGDDRITSTGVCSLSDGYQNFISFDTPEKSVAGYIHNLLYDDFKGKNPNGFYPKIRAAVRQARAKNPAGVASAESVLPGLIPAYATDPAYLGKLRGIIRANNLEQLDKNSCQSCIEKQQMNKPQAAQNAVATS